MMSATVKATDAIRSLGINVNVKVHGLWRVRLGCFLIKLASRVMRVPVAVSGDDEGRPGPDTP